MHCATVISLHRVSAEGINDASVPKSRANLHFIFETFWVSLDLDLGLLKTLAASLGAGAVAP